MTRLVTTRVFAVVVMLSALASAVFAACPAPSSDER